MIPASWELVVLLIVPTKSAAMMVVVETVQSVICHFNVLISHVRPLFGHVFQIISMLETIVTVIVEPMIPIVMIERSHVGGRMRSLQA